MKFLKITVILVGFLLISCQTQGEVSTSELAKVKEIIKINKDFISKGLARDNSIQSFQSTITFVKEIEVGNCGLPKEVGIIDHSLYLLNTFSYKDNLQAVIKATRLLECISSLQIDKEYHYISLVYSMMPNVGEISAFKLIYENLYSNFIPNGNTQKLGLIEFSMLECNGGVLSYLKQQNYPENANNLFSSLEYAYFKKLTSDLCHEYQTPNSVTK